MIRFVKMDVAKRIFSSIITVRSDVNGGIGRPYYGVKTVGSQSIKKTVRLCFFCLMTSSAT